MITRLLARLRRGRRHRGPSGERILARDLAAGQIVSCPEWAGGDPVRIISAFAHQDEMFVRYQDVGAHRPAWADIISAGTFVTLNPRQHVLAEPATPPHPRWRRALTAAGLTALTLLGTAVTASSTYRALTGHISWADPFAVGFYLTLLAALWRAAAEATEAEQ